MIVEIAVIFLPTLSYAMQMCDQPSGTLYTGTYTDGSGTHITSDRVTHPYKFPKIRKCWYDYYVVNASLVNAPWRKSTGDIYCTGTYTCTVSALNGTEFYQIRTSGISINVGLKSPDVTVSGGPEEIPSLPEEADESKAGDGREAEVGLFYTVQLSTTGCYSATYENQCQWNDGQCHNVWTSQQILKQVGYERQVCNWSNGGVTECMADIEIDTPTTYVNYECGAECGTQEMIIPSTSSTSTTSTTQTTPPASTITVQETTTVATSTSSPSVIATQTPAASAISIKAKSTGLRIKAGNLLSAIFSVVLLLIFLI